LGLRYAPDLRFFKDNSLDILKQYEEERDNYMEEAKEEKKDKELSEAGLLSGSLAEMSKPILTLLEYIKVFKRLSPGERIAFMATVPENL
jgi:hypothetical protein